MKITTRFALMASVAFGVTAPALAVAQQSPAPPLLNPSAPAPGEEPTTTTSTDARALAETLFFTARGLMEAGRYAQACGKLAESYRLDPAAGTLLNLAVCNEKIGKIASAWGEFRDAASEAKRMNRPDREKLATDSYEALQPQLPFLAISVPPAVRAIRGLVISRNGVPLQSAAWDTELPVDPGQVEVIERAPGYKPKTLFVTVTYKEHGTLTAVPLEVAPIERPPQPFWTARRSVGALVIAAGVAAGVAGIVFGVHAENQKKSSDSSCPNYGVVGQRCTATGATDMSNANVSAWLSNGGFALAAIGLGIGGYFFIFPGGQDHPSTTGSTGWSWAVNGIPRGASGLLSHSF